jgi:spermidine synthase
MSVLSRFRPYRARRAEAPVQVSERDGLRSLHLGSDTVQSTMRLSDPVQLVLSYTRAMMGFLLFHPNPRHLFMVGLGGGSLAKFAYHRLPQARVTVVENSAEVIRVARQLFDVPDDDTRLRIMLGDGGEWVRRPEASCDVLMVDAFDGQSQVEALASEAFYGDCAAALDRDGVLVLNLWSSDQRFVGFLQRVEKVFDGRVLCLPAERRGNVAVFAFRRTPEASRWEALRLRARQLEAAHGLEFPSFVTRLSEMNAHTSHRLIV